MDDLFPFPIRPKELVIVACLHRLSNCVQCAGRRRVPITSSDQTDRDGIAPVTGSLREAFGARNTGGLTLHIRSIFRQSDGLPIV